MKNKFILRLYIATTLSSSLLMAGSLSATEITRMVVEIKKERIGISILKLQNTANPFVIYVPKKKEIKEETIEEVQVLAPLEVVYKLKAILNKAAFIDNKWYRQGDEIGNYKVGYVSSHSVILKSENSNRTLSLEKKKKNFIKLNRGYR